MGYSSALGANLHLSVSSVGSIPLQLTAESDGLDATTASFSILSRIDTPATPWLYSFYYATSSFSILSRIDTPATGPGETPAHGV